MHGRRHQLRWTQARTTTRPRRTAPRGQVGWRDATPDAKAARANDSNGARVVLDLGFGRRPGRTGVAPPALIEDNTAVLAAPPRRASSACRNDAVGGTVSRPPGKSPNCIALVPWVEPPGNAKAAEDVRKEAVAQIVSP